MKEIITNSFEETQKLGEDFAKTLKGGEVLCLYGDLGSGKTTFMQGLAKGLHVNKKVISPTFIIMRTYQISSLSEQRESKGLRQAQAKNLYHVDLYRIEGEKDVESIGLLELMHDSENIVAIEWPERIENILPENRISMYFEYLDEEKRKIRF